MEDSDSPAERPQTGAVVVTYRTPPGLLARCRQSLVKNGITNVAVISNDAHNVGFAAAANRGAAQLKNKYILFLNPDAALFPNVRPVFEHVLNTRPDAGAAGLMLCSADGTPESTSVGPKVTPLSVITRHLTISSLPQHTAEVGWVSAGALVVRRRAFEHMSGFDPRFFLYWEDVDACRRLQMNGWRVMYLPSCRVLHTRGASLTDQAQRTKLYDASADKYFRKHYARPIWLAHRSLRSMYRYYSPQVR